MDVSRSAGLDPRVRLRHLVCFLEVVRLKGVAHAAAGLGLSQPAVSKTIQELEAILGVELFDRSRRNLVLSSFGEVFLRYAGASVTALKQGMRSMARVKADNAAALTVGALPTVSARILPAATAHFTSQQLGMKLHIVTGPNTYLLSQLRLGEVDLVIGRMAEPDMMRGFAFEHLYSEQIVFVVRPGHPLLAASPFDIAAVCAFEILMPPPGAIIRPTVERFFITHAIGPVESEIETVSDAFARNYVRRTDAIWIISEGVVVEDVEQGLLVGLPVDTSETSGPVGLTTRTDTPSSLPAELFAQSLRDVVAGLAAGGGPLRRVPSRSRKET